MSSNVVKIKEITEIINERKFIDEALQEGYMDTVNTTKILYRLAKHYVLDLKYRQARTVKALDAYMIAHYPCYNEHTMYQGLYKRNSQNNWESLYRKLYRLAENSTICDVDGIWITKAELDTIAHLHNKVLERLAFVLLCYAKLSKIRNPDSKGWVYSNKYRDVFSQARITCKKAERYIMLATLKESGYLYGYQMPPPDVWDKMSEYRRNECCTRMNDCRITFMNDDSEKIIYVDDWRELGYYYRRYKGENIIKCAKCGKLDRGNKNGTKKYCKECAGTTTNYESIYKQCRCVDCGKIFTINANARARKRCDVCAVAERKAHNREMYLKRKSNSTILAEDGIQSIGK